MLLLQPEREMSLLPAEAMEYSFHHCC